MVNRLVGLTLLAVAFAALVGLLSLVTTSRVEQVDVDHGRCFVVRGSEGKVAISCVPK